MEEAEEIEEGGYAPPIQIKKKTAGGRLAKEKHAKHNAEKHKTAIWNAS